MDIDTVFYVLIVITCVLSGGFTLLRVVMWHIYHYTKFGRAEQLKDMMSGRGLATFPIYTSGSFFMVTAVLWYSF